MKLGTKSLLFGAHCWFLHPWFVAWAWWKLYGFEAVLYVPTYLDLDDIPTKYPQGAIWVSLWNWRLWLAFLVHDWGYWGLSKMDDEEGERHPVRGAKILLKATGRTTWYHLVLYHSRFLSKSSNVPESPLCYADKLAIALTPWWLYLPMVRLTGEIREYQAAVKHVEDIGFAFKGNTWHEDREWLRLLQNRMVDFCQNAKTLESPESSRT